MKYIWILQPNSECHPFKVAVKIGGTGHKQVITALPLSLILVCSSSYFYVPDFLILESDCPSEKTTDSNWLIWKQNKLINL
jgi:hypothetical protein